MSVIIVFVFHDDNALVHEIEVGLPESHMLSRLNRPTEIVCEEAGSEAAVFQNLYAWTDICQTMLTPDMGWMVSHSLIHLIQRTLLFLFKSSR
jgi:hypothetical protein